VNKLQLNSKLIWVYVLSFIFILVNAVFIYKENLLFNIVPLAVLVILFAIFSLKKLFYIVLFLVPLSVPLKDLIPNLEFDMFLPTEPLLVGILLLFLFKILIERKFDRNIALHPVSIAIYINLFWILITVLTSTMPGVSIKVLLARLWFLVTFYFIATQIFKNFNDINKYYWFYIIPFLLVIAYSIIRLAGYGFLNYKAANIVMTPFYNDHTSYGAVLAMYIPVIIGLAIYPKYSAKLKTITWIILAVFIVAIIFSYTRAAWLSLVGVLGVLVLVLMKIKFRTVVLFLGTLIFLFLSFQTQIFISLEQNRQDSSADLGKHLQSISNISSDASNVERINRWKCALRMFAEKPVFGWGPGTYQFHYAKYQFSEDKTIISTNYGDMGNAHSEYIGPLADSGVMGMLTYLAILIAVSYTAVNVFRLTKKREIKIISMVSFLGLFTYFIHGVMNNFLDTDKASAPFWGFIAIIVALDVYHKNSEDKPKEISAEITE